MGTIFHCVTNLFSCVIRNHVSLASHNHNPFTRSYRGNLSMYLWYFKKKGVNVGNPRHKNMFRDQICVATPERCWPKVPTFGCRGDMLPTCWQHSQPSAQGMCPISDREHSHFVVMNIISSILLFSILAPYSSILIMLSSGKSLFGCGRM